MSKAGALSRLKAYIDGQTVQPGMFSTLDELIKEAPFEANTLDQWKAYLKPGRMLKREGAEFPLKKEEMDWSIGRLTADPSRQLTKDEIRELVQLHRPDMRVALGTEVLDSGSDPRGSARRLAIPDSWIDEAAEWELEFPSDTQPGTNLQELKALGRITTVDPAYGSRYGGGERLFHSSPEGRYHESITRMPGTIDYGSHFTPDTLSWSRASTHYTVPGESGGSVRLIEEIQSDLHARAADPIYTDPMTGKLYTEYQIKAQPEAVRERVTKSRLGHLTKEAGAEYDQLESRLRALKTAEASTNKEIRELVELGELDPSDPSAPIWRRKDDIAEEIDQINQLTRKYEAMVPDAPYKNPKDYGALELRKQLLDAVEDDNDYLALVKGADQVERYEMGMTEQSRRGMEHVYDKIYRGELDKLARRYGAEVVDIPVNLSTTKDVRLGAMTELDIESIEDFTSYVNDMVHGTDITDALDGVDDLKDMFHGVQTRMEGNLEMATGFDEKDLAGIYGDIKQVRKSVEELYEPTSADEDGAVEAWNERVAQPLGDISSKLHDIYEGYELFWSGGSGGLKEKTFPAIRLTDEVKKKVKELGVPQFARGGMVGMYEGGGVKEAFPGMEDVTSEQWKEWGLQSEALRRLRAMQEAQKEAELTSRWQEGDGPDEESALLKYLKATTRSLAGAVPFIEDDTRQYISDTMRYPFAGIASQWQSLDPETGEASFVMPMQPMEFSPFMSEEMMQDTIDYNNMVREHNKKFRPNIIDETKAIAALPGMFMPETFGDAPEWAEEAMMRSAEVSRQIEEDMEIPPPEGFLQGTSQGLGIMLGQVPVPGSQIKAMAAPLLSSKAAKIATAPARAGVEFFSPVVTPKPSNYAAGALFGGALTELPELLGPTEEGALTEELQLDRIREDMEREELVRDQWSDVESWDEKLQILSDERVGDVFWHYLTEADREEIVEELKRRGYDVGEDDAE